MCDLFHIRKYGYFILDKEKEECTLFNRKEDYLLSLKKLDRNKEGSILTGKMEIEDASSLKEKLLFTMRVNYVGFESVIKKDLYRIFTSSASFEDVKSNEKPEEDSLKTQLSEHENISSS